MVVSDFSNAYIVKKNGEFYNETVQTIPESNETIHAEYTPDG